LEVLVATGSAFCGPLFRLSSTKRPCCMASAQHFLRSLERTTAVKLHGSATCLDVPFGTDPRVFVRVETSRATYGWTRKLKASPAGATKEERRAFAEHHVGPDSASRAACLCTWYDAVERMTATPIADLLVHGDVVVRMCELFAVTVYEPQCELRFGYASGELRFAWSALSKAVNTAEIMIAIGRAMGYGTASEFLATHRIVGVEASVGAEGGVVVKRKLQPGTAPCQILLVAPVWHCAAPECATAVRSTAMALCVPCATRLRGVLHAHTRSFVVRSYARDVRLLVEVSGPELENALLLQSPREPTLPMFVEPPGPYHLPDDVSAHVLYIARLCKERHAAESTEAGEAKVSHALARGIIDTPVMALDAARFRPGLEAVYAKVRELRAHLRLHENLVLC
jgi:hypothetical protein